MRLSSAIAICALCTAAMSSPALAWVYSDMKGADLGVDADLHGAVPYPKDNPWNTDISKAPVDPNSDNLIASIGLSTGLHPDFGAGYYQHSVIGIPYVVVPDSQMYVTVHLKAYKDESDKGPYPVPMDAPIEGMRDDGKDFGGDRHVLVIDRDTNRLYEMGRAFPRPDISWRADAGAIFHLDSNDMRPTAKRGWTSADAAGLSIFSGLVRYDEVAAGMIPHALRFTVAQTRRAYVKPANHWASDNDDPNLPPMGMRVRLKASYQIPQNFSLETEVILQALKTYGMMVADNGSNWYMSGAPDDRWNNDHLVSELRQVTGSNFEVVKMGKIHTP
jgi:hypothetical protein